MAAFQGGGGHAYKRSAGLLSKGRLRCFRRNPDGLRAMDTVFRRSGSESHNLSLAYILNASAKKNKYFVHKSVNSYLAA